MSKWKIHAIIGTILFLIVINTCRSINKAAEQGDESSAITWLPIIILLAIYFGIMFVLYVLPNLVDTATTSVLSSNAEIEHSPLHDARAAFARGEYQEAITHYEAAIKETNQEEHANDEPDRLPWVEIAKIQHHQLEEPYAAIQTLQSAVGLKKWPANDTGYFMSRMAEIYMDDLGNKEQARVVLEQIIEELPESRFSANAAGKLREMDEA